MYLYYCNELICAQITYISVVWCLLFHIINNSHQCINYIDNKIETFDRGEGVNDQLI